jgi:hypothetical protein
MWRSGKDKVHSICLEDRDVADSQAVGSFLFRAVTERIKGQLLSMV